jgi:hypothetical protein
MRVTADPNPPPRWPLIAVAALSLVAVGIIVGSVLNAHAVNHWLGVHTGTTNEPGAYYAFWSGFGSDIAELGILGAIGTAKVNEIHQRISVTAADQDNGENPADSQ